MVDHFSLLFMVVAGCLVLLSAFVRRIRKPAAWFALVTTMVPGASRIVIQHQFWNVGAKQIQEIREFNRLTNGPVLDGFSGLGCVKPHASYWWWINHHSLPLIRREGAAQSILELVRARVPHVIVFDEDLQGFGSGLPALLEAGYDPVPFHGKLLFIRRDSH